MCHHYAYPKIQQQKEEPRTRFMEPALDTVYDWESQFWGPQKWTVFILGSMTGLSYILKVGQVFQPQRKKPLKKNHNFF